ncbi:hypothetical protein FRC10_001355, partial [Ceratobasidium sp. 414]
WQGGIGAVPWTKLSRDANQIYIEERQLPSGVDGLIDPHSMTRHQLECWYRHIWTGQSKELDEAHIFQFARVDKPSGQPLLLFTEFCRQQPTSSGLKYTPEEKLYALKVAQGADIPTRASWHGLPLARHCYRPFDGAMQIAIAGISSQKHQLDQAMDLLDAMEDHGAIHVGIHLLACYRSLCAYLSRPAVYVYSGSANLLSSGYEPRLVRGSCDVLSQVHKVATLLVRYDPSTIDSSPKGALNAHFPVDLSNERMKTVIGKSLLPTAFFDIEDKAHDSLALSTLSTWLKSPNYFRH